MLKNIEKTYYWKESLFLKPIMKRDLKNSEKINSLFLNRGLSMNLWQMPWINNKARNLLYYTDKRKKHLSSYV